MIEFFMNNLFCFITYSVIILLIIFSMTKNKAKGYILGLALVLYVVDISILLVLGFTLLRVMIITGVIFILAIASIKEGEINEL